MDRESIPVNRDNLRIQGERGWICLILGPDSSAVWRSLDGQCSADRDREEQG